MKDQVEQSARENSPVVTIKKKIRQVFTRTLQTLLSNSHLQPHLSTHLSETLLIGSQTHHHGEESIFKRKKYPTTSQHKSTHSQPHISTWPSKVKKYPPYSLHSFHLVRRKSFPLHLKKCPISKETTINDPVPFSLIPIDLSLHKFLCVCVSFFPLFVFVLVI